MAPTMNISKNEVKSRLGVRIQTHPILPVQRHLFSSSHCL